jgi:hypothetical protein
VVVSSCMPWPGTQKLAVLLAHEPNLPAPEVAWGTKVREKFFSNPGDGSDLCSYIRATSYGRADLVGDVFGPFEAHVPR